MVGPADPRRSLTPVGIDSQVWGLRGSRHPPHNPIPGTTLLRCAMNVVIFATTIGARRVGVPMVRAGPIGDRRPADRLCTKTGRSAYNFGASQRRITGGSTAGSGLQACSRAAAARHIRCRAKTKNYIVLATYGDFPNAAGLSLQNPGTRKCRPPLLPICGAHDSCTRCPQGCDRGRWSDPYNFTITQNRGGQ
jgi:hypothetical protein